MLYSLAFLSFATLSTSLNFPNVSHKEALLIFKGYYVDIADYPYAVLLRFEITRPASCGASLITHRALLTSAYCALEKTLKGGQITAFLGATVPSWAQMVRKVKAVQIHPKYDSECKYNVAVLLMEHPVPLKAEINPIALAGSVPDNGIGIVTGWGRQSIISNKPGKLPPNRFEWSLAASDQKIIGKSACEKHINFTLDESIFCTQAIKGSIVHLDDLGDGLLKTDPVEALLGVLSCVRKTITIFTSVPHTRIWIRDTVQKMFESIQRPKSK